MYKDFTHIETDTHIYTTDSANNWAATARSHSRELQGRRVVACQDYTTHLGNEDPSGETHASGAESSSVSQSPLSILSILPLSLRFVSPAKKEKQPFITIHHKIQLLCKNIKGSCWDYSKNYRKQSCKGQERLLFVSILCNTIWVEGTWKTDTRRHNKSLFVGDSIPVRKTISQWLQQKLQLFRQNTTAVNFLQFNILKLQK